LRGAFIASSAFAMSASIIMGILPAFAKHSLEATPSGYGALLSALGVGAIASGVSLKRVRARFGFRATVAAGIAIFGAAIFVASRAAHVVGAAPCFFIAGLGWIACLSSLSATVQLTASDESKSRVTALYQLTFYASATVGAAFGGSFAERFGERAAVALGGIAAVLAAPIALRAVTTHDVSGVARESGLTG
jgi:predicted MFS family arabinose efflux permease